MKVLDPEDDENKEQAIVKPDASGLLGVAMSRAAQEVSVAMLAAKRFPRDVNAAYARIMQGCKRKSLAEQAAYAYPRGGTRVTGPSIRLAEHLAQNWGNFESGVIELERREGESIAMAYSWDLETNSRDVKVFTVEHVRERGETKGGNVKLTDPRDVYELLANQGARRKRACILALIPGDIVDAAEAECDKTLKGDNSEPLIDRVRTMAAVFLEIGIPVDLLEKRLGHNLDATNENELVGLRKIYVSLRDGMSKREDWFAPEPSEQPTGKQSFGFKKAPEADAKEPSKEPPKKEAKKAEAPKPAAHVEVAPGLSATVTPSPQPTVAPTPEPTPQTPPRPAADLSLEAEARAREQAEAAPHHQPATLTGFSEPVQTTPPPPPPPPSSAPSPDLIKELTRLGKDKGVNMFDLSAYAKKSYGKGVIDCSTLEIQAILGKLKVHVKGERFV